MTELRNLDAGLKASSTDKASFSADCKSPSFGRVGTARLKAYPFKHVFLKHAVTERGMKCPGP